jgi:predicted GNAT family N-acyltransferase
MTDKGFDFITIADSDLTMEQREAIFTFLIGQCFSEVSHQEIEEDYFPAPISHVLCHLNDELVSCASAYVREIEYNGQLLRLGGIGVVCTRPDLRGQGIATRICTDVLQLLTQARCDVVFLATTTMARQLYEKMGFRPLSLFSWENSHGQIKTGTNGMVAAACSPLVAEAIWQDNRVFHVGRGYW